jgi:hypothetical protein
LEAPKACPTGWNFYILQFSGAMLSGRSLRASFSEYLWGMDKYPAIAGLCGNAEIKGR